MVTLCGHSSVFFIANCSFVVSPHTCPLSQYSCTVTNVYMSKWHIHSSWLTRDSLFTVVSGYSVHYSCFSLILFIIFWFSSDDLMWELIGAHNFSWLSIFRISKFHVIHCTCSLWHNDLIWQSGPCTLGFTPIYLYFTQIQHEYTR